MATNRKSEGCMHPRQLHLDLSEELRRAIEVECRRRGVKIAQFARDVLTKSVLANAPLKFNEIGPNHSVVSFRVPSDIKVRIEAKASMERMTVQALIVDTVYKHLFTLETNLPVMETPKTMAPEMVRRIVI